MITSTDVRAAAARIAGHVRTTPVLTVEPEAFHTLGPVLLKLELFQHSGSFKARGAFNRILAAAARGEVPEAGVIAASGGNAGLAVAHAATRLGVPAEIFVPEAASPVKVRRLRELGARVTVTGAFYAEAHAAARGRAAATGACEIHAYDQPEVAAGQGTLGLELAEQAAPAVLDTVLVAVGGGGLLAGVATALAGGPRVVAVEPERIPTLHAALAAGAPVDVAVAGIAADSLGARRIGRIGYQVAASSGVRCVLVDDKAIRAARRLLWERVRVLAEYGGATALAALCSGAYRPEPDERVGVVVCGGNTDPAEGW